MELIYFSQANLVYGQKNIADATERLESDEDLIWG